MKSYEETIKHLAELYKPIYEKPLNERDERDYREFDRALFAAEKDFGISDLNGFSKLKSDMYDFFFGRKTLQEISLNERGE